MSLTPEQEQAKQIEKVWLLDMAGSAPRQERRAALALLQANHRLNVNQVWGQVQATYLPKILEEIQSAIETQMAKTSALEAELAAWRKHFLFRVFQFFFHY
jgi:hypothetical protein